MLESGERIIEMQTSFVLLLIVALIAFANAHAAMLANTFRMMQAGGYKAPTIVSTDDDDDDEDD